MPWVFLFVCASMFVIDSILSFHVSKDNSSRHTCIILLYIYALLFIIQIKILISMIRMYPIAESESRNHCTTTLTRVSILFAIMLVALSMAIYGVVLANPFAIQDYSLITNQINCTFDDAHHLTHIRQIVTLSPANAVTAHILGIKIVPIYPENYGNISIRDIRFSPASSQNNNNNNTTPFVTWTLAWSGYFVLSAFSVSAFFFDTTSQRTGISYASIVHVMRVSNINDCTANDNYIVQPYELDALGNVSITSAICMLVFLVMSSVIYLCLLPNYKITTNRRLLEHNAYQGSYYSQ